MKALLLSLAIFGGAQVFAAAKDCTPYIVANGEAAGEYVYPCGKNNATVTYTGCKEGEVAYTSVFNGNFYEQVPITCHNGTFYRGGFKDVPHVGCKEGQIAYSNEYDQSGNLEDVTVVCKGGRFVPANR